MLEHYVYQITSPRYRQRMGAKTEKVAFLQRKGFPVPESLVCLSDAYDHYRADNLRVVDTLSAELNQYIAPDKLYAVHSSANVEDQHNHSFAGQFKSVLNAQGAEEVWQGIWSIWATAESERVQTYLEKNGLSPDDLKMAILIQEMVDVKYAGVAFSKNPLTGMDEIVIEAVRGSGEDLVQKGHTPERWVYKWGTWIDQPETSTVPQDVIKRVADQTKTIARQYGRPVDLEWAFDGGTVYWLQLREITSLDVNIYSNRIAKDMFPGLIKPLVWSVNVPLVNGAWVRIFTELIGPNDLDPNSLAQIFYNRAYFNMSAVGQIFELLGFPRESLELLMGIEQKAPDRPSFKPTLKTYRLLPRMMINAIKKIGFGRRIEAFLPTMRPKLEAFQHVDVAALSQQELLDKIDALYALAQQTAYFNIITPLLMQIYHALLKQRAGALGVDFDQLDVTGEVDDYRDLLPNTHLAALHKQFERLPEAQKDQIRQASFLEFQNLAGIDAFQDSVQRFLTRFGHFSDSGNDFSVAPWRETPDLILKMILEYTPAAGSTRDRTTYDDLNFLALQKPFFRWVYLRAQRFQLYREQIGSLYTYGYGLLRRFFLQMGRNFVNQGALKSSEDVFFLTFAEVRAGVTETASAAAFQHKVDQRKAELEANRTVSVPGTIFGDDPLPVDDALGTTLEGFATSRGHYVGPVRVVRGLRDFDTVQEGDVLTVPFTDIGWSPLFSKAGAVIAESGGLLSHSSILAREYNIPCIVSVSNACRLRNGTMVTVDGYEGKITILEDRDSEGASA